MISTIKDIISRYDSLKNFYQFSQNKQELQKVLDSLPSDFEQDGFATYVKFAERWTLAGKNAFSLHKDLIYALIATDPPKGEDTQFPFTEFVIDLPKGLIKDLNQIWIGTGYTDDVGEPMLFMVVQADDNNTRTLQHATIKEFVAQKFNMPVDLDKTDVHILHLAYRLVFNFLHWMTALKPKVELNEIKRPVTKQGLKDLKYAPKEWIIGRNVKITPAFAKAVESSIVSVEAPVPNSPPSIMFMVRGHFRRQPCGFQRTLRKLI
jgi:hypothetical protein